MANEPYTKFKKMTGWEKILAPYLNKKLICKTAKHRMSFFKQKDSEKGEKKPDRV